MDTSRKQTLVLNGETYETGGFLTQGIFFHLAILTFLYCEEYGFGKVINVRKNAGNFVTEIEVVFFNGGVRRSFNFITNYFKEVVCKVT